jgi:hypothetical protein
LFLIELIKSFIVVFYRVVPKNVPVNELYFLGSLLSTLKLFKDGRYFEEITKSDETHPKVERF